MRKLIKLWELINYEKCTKIKSIYIQHEKKKKLRFQSVNIEI